MVRAKKHLGQHFLKDETIAQNITEALQGYGDYQHILEIGPGTGVLTQFLLEMKQFGTWMIDVDRDAVRYLGNRFPQARNRIILDDFLKHTPKELLHERYGVIGNFPYHISSQILFKILETPQQIPEVVCMLQKEVAQRLASPPGNRRYGILSVLLQAYYKVEYLFEVGPENFRPPPKVDSAVIRLQTLSKQDLGCDEIIFRKLIKQGFQNRRKTLRNALKPFNLPPEVSRLSTLDRRAEELTVEEYVSLTKIITPFWSP